MPVDPIIPIPDIPGADASAGGLPQRSELPLRQRLVVESSAITDIALRTVVASIIGAAMIPPIVAEA
ncbi:MAG TPA: alpha/beta hydrolase, partial [Mycobacterium sp.]|nr:alpha/beta hydrolase [Mycobacterium sp.]